MNTQLRRFLLLLVLLQSCLMQTVASAQEIVWLGDLSLARTRAQTDEQKILVVFDQPNCPWCVKLERETLTSPAVLRKLSGLTLVKLDITEHPELAAQYRILGVPHSLMLDSDNALLGEQSGFLPPEAYSAWIEETLNPDNRKSYHMPTEEADLQAWRELLREMGRDGSAGIRDKILSREPFPAKAMVELLWDEQLKIRLGALDVLELKAGTSFDYDPWVYPPNDAQYEALTKWEQWSGDDSAAHQNTGQVTIDLKRLTQNLIAGDERQILNATRILLSGGATVRKELRAFRLSQAALPEKAQRQLRKVEYAILLREIDAIAPVRTANALMFGSEDAQLEALRDLTNLGKRVLPIVQDFLASDNALVRETAIEAALAIDSFSMMDVVAAHLEEETNKNVIQTTLRALASVKTPAATKVLVNKLDSENEDVLIVALSSLAEQDAPFEADVLKPLLKDERWRVRARTLEVIQKRSLRVLTQDVRPLVEDEDSFVSKLALEIYTNNAGSEAVGLLEKYFQEDPTMRTSILASFASLRLALPESIHIQISSEEDTKVLLSYIPHLAMMDAKGVPVLLKLSRRDNMDIVASALEALAEGGIDNPLVRQRLIQALSEQEPRFARIILSNLEYRNENQYDNFGRPKKADGKKEAEMREAIRPWVTYQEDATIRHQAIVKLMLLGEADLGAEILENYDSLSSEDKNALVRKIGESTQSDAMPLLRRMLQDESQSMRQRIVSTLLSDLQNADAMEMVFSEVLSEESPLSFEDILGWEFFNMGSDLDNRDAVKAYIKWMNNFIKSDRVEANIVGLMMLSGQMEDRIAESLDAVALTERFLDSPDVFCRRAAWYALSQRDKTHFQKIMHRCVLDDSALVRMVAPVPFIEGFFQWENMLDSDTSYGSSSYAFYNYYGSGRTNDKGSYVKALNKLAEDADHRVRMFAFMALAEQGLSFDPQRLLDTVMAHEERHTQVNWVASYMVENYRKMDESYLPLLPLLQESYHSDDSLKPVYQYFSKFEGYEGPDPDASTSDSNLSRRNAGMFDSLFGGSSDADGPTVILLNEEESEETQEDTVLGEPESASTQAVAEGSLQAEQAKPYDPFAEAVELPEITVVFFSDPSCQDCAQVSRWLEEVGSAFPSLAVRKYNIRTVEAMRMNEALSQYFDLPTVERLVAPTIFTASGALVREEISPTRLRLLIQQSAQSGDTAWLDVYEQSEEVAGEHITERFKKMTLGVVLFAGLVDGINPCAFATIVFLLSYLQIARRGPRETLLAGAVYAVAVFATYFLIGLGFLEVLVQLDFTQTASFVLNIVMAALVFVIMVLTVRDAVLAFKGKAREMSLQLPDFLKNQIRKVIRENTRTRNILIGSFIMGVTVSLLELACTGQVYTPTILYVVQQDVERARALFYLAAYNFSFIAPLLIVLGATWFGLTSEKLQRFFQRHIVTAKVGMALFFMLLFALFTASLV